MAMQRQALAQLFSDLRPAYRVRVPFFKLAAHTSPTRWNLYRSLLRFAPGDEVMPADFSEPTDTHDTEYAKQRLDGTYARCLERIGT